MKKKLALTTKNESLQKEELSPALKKIVGTVKVPVDFDEKKSWTSILKTDTTI